MNDAGAQVLKFAAALQARARGEEPEEYLGDYIADIAERIPGAAGMELEDLARAGMEHVLAGMRETLERFRVEPFDVWFSERSLYEGDPSPVQATLDAFDAAGVTYRAEDAVWLRTTDYGDDKDRVLVKSDGSNTYLAPDIAYHQHKRGRGFERLIDVWGADHHGYILRHKAAYSALGGDPEDLELLIMQFVNLVRGGQPVSMSKRAGEFVTLDELIEEIGVRRGALVPARPVARHDDRGRPRSREARDVRQPCLLRPVRPRAAGEDPCARERRAERDARRCARRRRAGTDQEAGCVPQRGRRGRRPARAPPDRHLRARTGPRPRGLLRALQGHRGRQRGLPARAVRSHPAGHRPLARPARGRRARGHVAELRGCRGRRCRCSRGACAPRC